GGGWPLTCFLTPDDHIPIVVGTYFPKEARYGMPPFKQVLTQVENYFRRYPDEIAARGASLLEALGKLQASPAGTAGPLSREPLERARDRLAAAFDAQHGGFGGAPKFPHATALELLLEYSAGADADRSRGRKAEEAGRIVRFTLDRMARGGLYDQLGGGFFRYSVDQSWSIPHFEKMLYDNAELLSLYSDAFAATGEPLYRRVASETADWVVRAMQDAQGGYYSTLDADSEGEEGKYYLWTPEEFDAALTGPEAAVAKRTFGLDDASNFEGRAWHLSRAESSEAPGRDAKTEQNEQNGQNERNDPPALLARARSRLLEAREQRVPPGRDEKLLVSWNGLMIRGMAKAARRLGRPELAASATRAVDFIRAELCRDGRLCATYKDGRARLSGYLDDYAFLADGLLELLEQRWRTEDLELAVALTDVVLAHFEDANGGFFFTADDHEKLIHRPKPWLDEALPSGNAVMLRVLLELGALLGERRYEDSGERGLKAALPSAAHYPDAHAALMLALARYLEPPELIVVRGEPGELPSWRAIVEAEYAPRRSAYCIPNDAPRLPGLLAERAARGAAVAYVCLGTECRAPITDREELRTALE
ncbi:MAG TPA: thioredoxin domain-containing protein, partial [Gammaproteobacteria bacterium]|nr:thioredoxin domain-containing protein [Gammaproteobacteria bacterium]